MTGRIIPKSTVTTADSGAHNALDLDVVGPQPDLGPIRHF